jgi:mannose-6-phosphate isomerase-like protein (cupin superfamily)
MKLGIVGTIVAVCITQTLSTQTGSKSAREAGPKPLLLETNEGEERLWRPEPGEGDLGGFILKVSPKGNGSQHLVVFTGETAPGGVIPTHKHLVQDEVLLIQKGTLHVHLGDQERDLHARDGVHSGEYLGGCEKHRHRNRERCGNLFGTRI